MTALAESQLREMLERLDKVQRVVDAYAKQDASGAIALLLDIARIRHRVHGWLMFVDPGATVDGQG
jgi:hypothetical protein